MPHPGLATRLLHPEPVWAERPGGPDRDRRGRRGSRRGQSGPRAGLGAEWSQQGASASHSTLISNFLQLRRRRRGRCPRSGKLPEKAGSISTLPQAAGPLSPLRSVVSKWAGVPGLQPSPSRAERSPGAHLPVVRLSPLPKGSSRLRGHACNPAPTSGLSPHLHHLPSAQGTPRASGAEIEAPLLPLPSSQRTAGAPQVRSSRASYGPTLTGPRAARPASLPSREPSARAPPPRGQQAKRSGARGPGGAAVLPIGAARVARTPSRRTSAHARGAALRAGELTCGGTWSCPPGAAAAAASSRRGGSRPAPSGDSASPGGQPRSERGHADR